MRFLVGLIQDDRTKTNTNMRDSVQRTIFFTYCLTIHGQAKLADSSYHIKALKTTRGSL